ncbi:unnamed protein product [Bursaphelenchus okinawaensis]|uniref:Uncharacterized protein n=1 Tax=Bursaphelenchus okinawaensis TaxID=465554 RepID=A0A811LCB8_9BILA|nr:unnamed protein product [Bursaphelenchus okinawaensis]CAG9120122.1 unnamed protein product [Bursaphelenchus okinawaensis]
MFSVVLCFILIGQVFGCQPDPGNHGSLADYELTTNPIFTFEYSPPLAWTWFTEPVEQQSPSASVALTLIRSTVEEKFINALKLESPFLPPNLNLSTDLLQPLEVQIVTDQAELTEGQGRVQLGVVATYCNATNETCTEEPLTLQNRLFLFNGPLLNGRQWKNVATFLFQELQFNAGVLFKAPINVTK